MTASTPLDSIKADLTAFLHLAPGDKISNLSGLLQTILNAVSAVEKLAGDAAGADKKAIVLWLINQYVHFPLVPEFLINDIASYFIDAFVGWLNARLGNDWLTKLINSPTVPATLPAAPVS